MAECVIAVIPTTPLNPSNVFEATLFTEPVFSLRMGIALEMDCPLAMEPAAVVKYRILGLEFGTKTSVPVGIESVPEIPARVKNTFPVPRVACLREITSGL